MTHECNLPEGFASGAALQVAPNRASIRAGLLNLFELSDTERRQIGERGHSLVARQFTWRRVAEQMAQLYEWVLGGGAPPPFVTST